MIDPRDLAPLFPGQGWSDIEDLVEVLNRGEMMSEPVETTVVIVRYFHPDAETADGMVEYSRTVRVDRLHMVIEAVDRAVEEGDEEDDE